MKKQNFIEFYKWKYENLYKIYWIVSIILVLSLIITIFTYEAYINNLKEKRSFELNYNQAKYFCEKFLEDKNISIEKGIAVIPSFKNNIFSCDIYHNHLEEKEK